MTRAGAVGLATILVAIGAADLAFAQPCVGLCPAQTTDQEALLAPFNKLLSSPAGVAVLNTNLQREEDIYLNSTRAQKVASGTVLMAPLVYANILLRAFPGSPYFNYNSAGLPSAPALPQSIQDTVTDFYDNTQINAMKPYFGMVNIYYNAYGLLPGQIDSLGNPPPYQVSALIHNNPFTVANSSALAAQTQQQYQPYMINWQDHGDSATADFPSAHTNLANLNALTYAILAPGYYQQLAMAAADFAYDLNVNGVHYPTDVIGGRILATYVTAQTLAGTSPYLSATGVSANLTSLSQTMQAYLGGGGSSVYAAACVGNIAGCVAGGAIPTAATYASLAQKYTWLLTYGLPPVSDTTLPPVVPLNAALLIATRFPYLNTAQLNQILASTELPSGGAIDNGTGWARLNLYTAAGGYGAFSSNVVVNMNAATGGLNAFDIWSNPIAGPGGFTLQGSGTLILAGNDSYIGGTNVQGGTLAVTGTLGGNLSVSPGATFVGAGGYAVAANTTLTNGGTFIEVNTPLINAGVASNTGTIVGDVNNVGSFSNNALVTGAFRNSGLLSGNGVVGALALLPGSIVAPGNSVGTIGVAGNLSVATGAIYQAQFGPTGADLIQVGGTATLAGGTVVATVIGNTPALGSAYPILTATGGVSGSFTSLTEPASGLSAGTRFDTLYGSSAISLVVTPGFYGNLATVGIAESGSERGVGGALDAIRLAPGVAMDPTRAALFGPLYALPAGGITTGLDELAPSIYADQMITARSAWYLMANAVSGQLAARRGLAADSTANTALGPNGSTIWFSGLAGYDTTSAGGGSPGFTAALGGAAAGIDVPVAPTARLGVAVGTVDGQTWSQSSGHATGSTAQLVTYGQWRSGMFFAEAQLGLMYQQENVRRTLALFGATAQGNTNGLAGGGGMRIGLQQTLGGWLIEPSLGFGGFDYHQNSLAESGGGALAENISGATLGSAETTLAVSAQRSFALSETVQVVAKGRIGWSHEFADNTASVSASFAGLSGSGFALTSAPVGRDAAVVGLGADVKVASWPVAMFASYGGAISGNSNAQSFNAGVRFTW